MGTASVRETGAADGANAAGVGFSVTVAERSMDGAIRSVLSSDVERSAGGIATGGASGGIASGFSSGTGDFFGTAGVGGGVFLTTAFFIGAGGGIILETGLTTFFLAVFGADGGAGAGFFSFETISTGEVIFFSGTSRFKEITIGSGFGGKQVALGSLPVDAKCQRMDEHRQKYGKKNPLHPVSRTSAWSEIC